MEHPIRLIPSIASADQLHIAGEIDRIGQRRSVRTILGVEVPNIVIPVSEGRDLVNLVETAAQQQKLILAGHDPVTDLSQHLRARAEHMEPAKAFRKGGKRNGRKNH